MTGQGPTRVGVIGLGDIGRGVAASCAGAGLPLVVCDVRDEPLAAFADQATTTSSPAELAAQCEVVVVAVVNDAQVLSVTSGEDGVLSAAAPGTVLVIVSTISPAALASVAASPAWRSWTAASRAALRPRPPASSSRWSAAPRTTSPAPARSSRP